MSETIEERAYAVLLYDIYGGLLTAKQQNVFEWYYQDDYSLGEIAEELGISRQGVHDNIKRSVKLLEEYEEKLHLAEKELRNRTLLEKAMEIIPKDEKNEKLTQILKSLLE